MAILLPREIWASVTSSRSLSVLEDEFTLSLKLLRAVLILFPNFFFSIGGFEKWLVI